jgi:hypothetical protein
LVLPTGTKGPPAWAPRSGHVEPLLSRFVSEPGLKVLGFSPDPLVPVPEPGQMGLFLLVFKYFYDCTYEYHAYQILHVYFFLHLYI